MVKDEYDFDWLKFIERVGSGAVVGAGFGAAGKAGGAIGEVLWGVDAFMMNESLNLLFNR